MQKCLFFFISALLLACTISVSAQEKKKIIIENADYSERNEAQIPGAILASGNVRVNHDGAIITCNKAYIFQDENYLKAFGNVQMVQGDTLFVNSKYAEYNANTKQAFAAGEVSMRSPDMTLVTDTLNFDRNIQQAYYSTNGRITNKENVLTSKSGRYFVAQKKFTFRTAVVITNPEYVVKSNHLDYYNNSGHSYLFGPSTITSAENYIYTEKGFYDSKKNVGHFLRKSYIKYKDRLIEGDSLFYDRNREFASATNNVKITDSINRGVVKGHYGEVYRQLDSMYITKRAVAINFVENDSVYIHGKKLLITGKPENRIIRAYKNARFFKTDMSGKCDSIHSSQIKGLTQMIGRPILWNNDNQMTGDVMHLISNSKTEKLDSLKVLNNAFLVSKDTLGTGFNQIKGLNLYGKFRDNKLREVDIVKNVEIIYYMRDDKDELFGIDKGVGSKMNLLLDGNKIELLTLINPESEIFPEGKLPENATKLRGFIWRGDERILSKDDIFPPEENALNEKIIKQSAAEMAKENVPMEIRKETLEYDKNNPPKK